MSEYEKFNVGVNVFVLRDDKLLLGQRKNVYGEGSWGLPGGHLELKENMEEAAQRELKEETGLEATEFEFVNIVNDIRQDEHYIQVGFLAKDAMDDEPRLMEPDKCCEWKWFDLDNLPDIFVGHIEQINAFKENIYFVDGGEE